MAVVGSKVSSLSARFRADHLESGLNISEYYSGMNVIIFRPDLYSYGTSFKVSNERIQATESGAPPSRMCAQALMSDGG
jgi:hypothetical protein